MDKIEKLSMEELTQIVEASLWLLVHKEMSLDDLAKELRLHTVDAALVMDRMFRVGAAQNHPEKAGVLIPAISTPAWAGRRAIEVAERQKAEEKENARFVREEKERCRREKWILYVGIGTLVAALAGIAVNVFLHYQGLR